MWQKCPVCDGNNFEGSNPCPTCNGHRIISELTGKPPVYEIKTGVPATTVCIGYEPSGVTTADSCKWCGKGRWAH